MVSASPHPEGVVVFVYLIGAGVLVFIGVLAFGGITGRVKLDDGCCCPSDPSKDLRMRD